MKEFIKLYKSGKLDWEETGFLSNLADDQKPQMIEIFEEGMKYVTDDDKKNQLILPILRRIYTELVNGSYSKKSNNHLLYILISVDDVMKSFNDLYNDILPHFYKLKNLDAEAEFCLLVARDYNVYLNKFIMQKYISNTLQDYLITLSRDKKIDSII
jgi:hypothetical protein